MTTKTVSQLLEELMLIPAPSGYEKEMAYYLKQKFENFSNHVRIDRVGNVIAEFSGRDSTLPRTMIFAHMDQIGFIVRRIETNGFIQVDRLGGIPEKILPGLQVLLRGEDGSWHPGIFGSKSHHATPPEEKYKVDPVTSLSVDIGASSAEEVHARGIYTGCPVIYHPAFQSLIGTRITGTAVDNRGGCAALIKIAELLQKTPPEGDVYLVGTVWEEFNLRGAMLAARTVHPHLALSLDVTLASDTADLYNRFDDLLGKGPCVGLYNFHGRGTLNGTIAHEPLFRLAKRTASELNLPLQRFASQGILTDASYLQLEEDGVACLDVGFPTRYTHTPVEMCDTSDIEALAVLCAGMMQRIDKSFERNRY